MWARKGTCDDFHSKMPESGWFPRQTLRKMRVLIADNIPLTLPNNYVEDNEQPAARKCNCTQCQESIYGDHYKRKGSVEQNVVHFFGKKQISTIFFVENATKQYSVTNEIMKR